MKIINPIAHAYHKFRLSVQCQPNFSELKSIKEIIKKYLRTAEIQILPSWIIAESTEYVEKNKMAPQCTHYAKCIPITHVCISLQKRKQPLLLCNVPTLSKCTKGWKDHAKKHHCRILCPYVLAKDFPSIYYSSFLRLDVQTLFLTLKVV